MNWRRGLFRVWVVLAIAWSAFAVFCKMETPDLFVGFVPVRFMVVPPLLLGGVMALVAWAASGFGRQSINRTASPQRDS